MKKKILILLLHSFLLSDIFNVPSDQYPTIQSGIDVAQHGDTVLVDQGIYYENLEITRSITLASRAIFDDLANWNDFNEIFWEWEVTNDNINNTIIDGSGATDDFGSVILISADYSCHYLDESEVCNDTAGCVWQEEINQDESGCISEEECISPEIIGFTIQNGIGTSVLRNSSETKVLGGGILFDVSNPIIEYNKFINNGSGQNCSGRDDCTDEGGAIYSTTSNEDWDFNNRISLESRCDVDEFSLSNNLYNGNDAVYGNSLANRGFEDTFDMSESIFDVANCSIEEVSPVWVYVEPEANLELEEIESNLCAFNSPNAYVDPNLDQECIEEGCGTFMNPFKTIAWALQMIMPSENSPVTIHLADGNYSLLSGESFPIILPRFVNIQGESQDLTVLDAMNSESVLKIERSALSSELENNISNLSMVNASGRAVIFYKSNVALQNCTIRDNDGGGIYIARSSAVFDSIIVNNNTSYFSGAGMKIQDSNEDIILNNVEISNNYIVDNVSLDEDWWYDDSYRNGAGLYLSLPLNSLELNNVDIHNNRIDLSLPPWYEIIEDDGSIAAEYISSSSAGGGLRIVASGNPIVPVFNNVNIYNNYSHLAGGVYISGDINISNFDVYNNNAIVAGGVYVSSEPTFENITIRNNSSDFPGSGLMCNGYYGMNCNINFSAENRSSIYGNNSTLRGNGKDIYANGHTLDVVLDTFTVMAPTDFHAYPIEDITFDILNSVEPQVNQDLYVSPDGDDDNSGLSFNDPIKTIYQAANMIIADNENPRTIFLDEGIYSPTLNNEYYPIAVPNNVKLKGINPESTILDAEGTSSVIRLINSENITIRDLTIKGGFSTKGSGIFSHDSNSSILNVIIKENILDESLGRWSGQGGGIYIKQNVMNLDSVYIVKNNLTYGPNSFSSGQGGGIFIERDATVYIKNSSISNNAALLGGAFFSQHNPEEDPYYNLPPGLGLVLDDNERSSIYSNEFLFGEAWGVNSLVLDTFTVSIPTFFYSAIDPENPLNYYDINIGVIEQIQGQDIYISSENGDDNNLGIESNNPIKTIKKALQSYIPDLENTSTFYLEDGLYLMDALPFFINTSVIGESRDQTIIDLSSLPNLQGFNIPSFGVFLSSGSLTYSHFTLKNGPGCLALQNTDFLIDHLRIKDNVGGGCVNGGGIGVRDSNGSIINTIVEGNHAAEQGGGIYLRDSNVLIDRTIVSNNTDNYCANCDYTNVTESSGIVARGSANVQIYNSTIYNNPIVGTSFNYDDYTLHIANSIIVNNADSNENSIDNATVIYSNLEDGESFSTTNITADPLFVDAENSNFSLHPNSLCIDSGTADVDQDGIIDIFDYLGLLPDMGAIEYNLILGDLNQDQYLNIFDIIILVEYVLDGEYVYYGDINQDSIIDVIDVVSLVSLILDF